MGTTAPAAPANVYRKTYLRYVMNCFHFGQLSGHQYYSANFDALYPSRRDGGQNRSSQGPRHDDISLAKRL